MAMNLAADHTHCSRNMRMPEALLQAVFNALSECLVTLLGALNNPLTRHGPLACCILHDSDPVMA